MSTAIHLMKRLYPALSPGRAHAQSLDRADVHGVVAVVEGAERERHSCSAAWAVQSGKIAREEHGTIHLHGVGGGQASGVVVLRRGAVGRRAPEQRVRVAISAACDEHGIPGDEGQA